MKNIIQKLVLIALLIFVPSMALADNGYKVTYDGGSLQGVKTGAKAHLYIDSDQVRIVKGKTLIATIPAADIQEISYGQDVHRRVGAAVGLAMVSLGVGAIMLLSKSKKHFVGITWSSGTHKGGFAMQCDKSDYRGVLAGLEGISGKHAVDSAALTVKN